MGEGPLGQSEATAALQRFWKGQWWWWPQFLCAHCSVDAAGALSCSLKAFLWSEMGRCSRDRLGKKPLTVSWQARAGMIAEP